MILFSSQTNFFLLIIFKLSNIEKKNSFLPFPLNNLSFYLFIYFFITMHSARVPIGIDSKVVFDSILKEFMPWLNTLHVEYLPKLKMIPQGLKFVTNLWELKLSYLTSELKRRVEMENGAEGEDFHKIHHIPSLAIY